MTIDEYNKCVDLYADALYRFVLKNLRDEPTAQDVVQETFEKVWLKASQVDFQKAKAYFFTTAYHAMLAQIKQGQRFSSLSAEQLQQFVASKPEFDTQKQIDAVLQQLPEIQRTVLLLRDYEGYNYLEIGEITGLTESQVKVYIFRARTTIKNKLVSIAHVL